MPVSNLTTLLNIEHPIIQAPMAGVTTPEFVAASAEAGILGSIGAGYLSAEETRKFIRKVKSLTEKPFAVNLFVPDSTELGKGQLQEAFEALLPIGLELGMSSWDTPISKSEFKGQVQALIEEGVKICSFAFGLPNEKTLRLLKENDVFLIGTATTVEEVILAEQLGMDAVVAQGSEAGGHRGSFYGEFRMIPLHELLPDAVNSVKIPVIAAGGVANKKMMDDMLSAGAQAVQIGTAFLATDESGAHPLYKKAILEAQEGSTILTNAFSGKTARGISNRFIKEMAESAIAPYPFQHELTKEIRKVAALQGKPEFMSLWAGENVHLTNAGKINIVIEQFR